MRTVVIVAVVFAFMLGVKAGRGTDQPRACVEWEGR